MHTRVSEVLFAKIILIHPFPNNCVLTGPVKEDEVEDSNVLPYCSLEKKKKSLGEMEQEFLQALQVLYIN